MENENFDLDQKPAANKDLWLFLIIIDIVCLCVFGFFLYKNLSARFFTPADGTLAAATVVETQAPVEEKQETPVEEVVVASVTEEQPAAKQQEPAPAKEVKPAPQQTPAETATQPQEKKESVIVKANPKSKKYRRVTFRYYGEGKKVSIVSGFTMAKPQALRKKKDYWETTLSIAPGRYRFLYIVDGVNTPDPYSPEEDGRSVVVVE